LRHDAGSRERAGVVDAEPGHFGLYSWANIMIARWLQGGTGPTIERVARVRELMDGEGFWASAQRTAVTGVRMQVSDESAMSIFSNLHELVAWLPQEHLKHPRCDRAR
jgi:hypothetical protein